MTAPGNTYDMIEHTVTFADASSNSVAFTVDAQSKRQAILTAAQTAQQGLEALVSTDNGPSPSPSSRRRQESKPSSSGRISLRSVR